MKAIKTLGFLALAIGVIFTQACSNDTTAGYYPPTDDGGDPGGGQNPGGCEGADCNITASLGDGTLIAKMLVQQGNPSSGHTLYTIGIPASVYTAYDASGNPLTAGNLSVKSGDTVKFNFGFDQTDGTWGVDCVNSFSLSVNNLSDLAFSRIAVIGTAVAIEFSAKASDSGNTTLQISDPSCTDDDADFLTGALGNGIVEIRGLSVPGNPQSAKRIYSISVSTDDYVAKDAAGNHLDEAQIIALPGTAITFEFWLDQAFQFDCVKSFQVDAENLQGLAFKNIVSTGDCSYEDPNGDLITRNCQAVSFGTTANDVGMQRLSTPVNSACN